MLFLLYIADILTIARRMALAHILMLMTQLYHHTPADLCVASTSAVVLCIGKFDRWMYSNRVKLNTVKMYSNQVKLNTDKMYSNRVTLNTDKMYSNRVKLNTDKTDGCTAIRLN